MFVGLRPLHREQNGTAPFAAHADTLDQTDQRQKHGAPYADAVVIWHEAHTERGDAGQQQGHDQRRLAANTVAIMAEYGRPNRSPDEADKKHSKRLENADQWRRLRKIEFTEYQASNGAVQQEVIPLDCGTHRAGHQGTTQLAFMFGVGKAIDRSGERSHLVTSRFEGWSRWPFGMLLPNDDKAGANAPDVLQPSVPTVMIVAHDSIVDNVVYNASIEL